MYADTVQNSCTVMKSMQLQIEKSHDIPLGMPMEWSPGIFLVEIDSMTLAIDLKGLLHPKLKSVTFFLPWNTKEEILHNYIYAFTVCQSELQ